MNLFIGRIPFALGMAFGLGALLALGRRPWLAAPLPNLTRQHQRVEFDDPAGLHRRAWLDKFGAGRDAPVNHLF